MAKILSQTNYARLTSQGVTIGGFPTPPRTFTASYVVGVRQGGAYHDLPPGAWRLPAPQP